MYPFSSTMGIYKEASLNASLIRHELSRHKAGQDHVR
uniref:Uncharacterized protein n=1 Tax=Arundo donax TaxID=35708 RepID=A0A0A9B0T3_ARUDO